MNQAGAEKEKIHAATGETTEKKNPVGAVSVSGQSGEKEEKAFEKMTKAELIQKVKDLTETGEKQYELYLRAQADMENMKKRAQREKEDWMKFSNESLIKNLLPALDALEQAVSHCAISNEDCLDALTEGVELTLKALKDALEKAGLEKVKAHGEAFDPNYHQAVSEMEDNSAEPGSVLRELQKGYLLNQRLLRPAMVVVNKRNQAAQNNMDG